MPIITTSSSIAVNAANHTLSVKHRLNHVAECARFLSGGWLGYTVERVQFVKDFSNIVESLTESGVVYVSEVALTAFVRAMFKKQLMHATTQMSQSGSRFGLQFIVDSVPQLKDIEREIPFLASMIGHFASNSLESSVQKLTDKLIDILQPLLCKPVAKTAGQAINASVHLYMQTYLGNQLQSAIFLLLRNQFDSPETQRLRDFFDTARQLDGLTVITKIFFMMLLIHTFSHLVERMMNVNEMDKAVARLSAHLMRLCPNDKRIPDNLYAIAVRSATAVVLKRTCISPESINLALDAATMVNDQVLSAANLR